MDSSVISLVYQVPLDTWALSSDPLAYLPVAVPGPRSLIILALRYILPFFGK